MYQPTERELEVLRSVIDEGSCKEAAAALHISPQTVKNLLYLFRQKAHVNSTERLVYEYRDALRAARRTL